MMSMYIVVEGYAITSHENVKYNNEEMVIEKRRCKVKENMELGSLEISLSIVVSATIKQVKSPLELLVK